MKGLKICGVSDPKTLNYILNHHQRPTMIGFISNYKKSRRFIEYEKLKDLINVDKKNVKFVSVLVNPKDNEILEKIKGLNFDYYQLYDVDPERTKEIKLKYELEFNVNVVTFNEGRIEIAFNENLDKNFIKELSNKLYEWTNIRWIILLSKKKGLITKKQEEKINKEKNIENVKKSKFYNEILDILPDAELLDFKANEIKDD